MTNRTLSSTSASIAACDRKEGEKVKELAFPRETGVAASQPFAIAVSVLEPAAAAKGESFGLRSFSGDDHSAPPATH